MIKFLHTGDLHLKAPPNEDSEYSLKCLEILIERANQEAVDAVLLCGDIFDQEKDYTDKPFCKKVIATFDKADMPLYYIPGNHEDHDGKFSKFKAINWGNKIKAIADVSLETFSKGEEEVEIACIPHRLNYEDFTDWNIPKKQTRHRLAMAHGSIPGFTFLGDEDDAGVLNPALFVHHEVSHVFMGHIHKADKLTTFGVDFFYAGSPRPVRRREEGARGYNIIEIGDSVKVSRKELHDVGVAHNLSFAVLGQDWAEDIKAACRHFSEIDRINVVLEGMVENKQLVEQEAEELKEELTKTYRRVRIKSEYLEPLETLIENEFCKDVYNKWLEKKPDELSGYEYQVWIQMLNSLRFMMEEFS